MNNTPVSASAQLPAKAPAAQVVCPPQPTKWHAHLSAVQAPTPVAAAARAPPPTPPSAKASSSGNSLAPSLLGAEVLLRPKTGHVFLGREERAVDADPKKHEWLIRAVEGAVGEYNILVANDDGGYRYLSVPVEGKDVDLWSADDGSGRQRWIFKQVGDTQYVIRLAGGKRDDRVYLGMRDDLSSVRLFSEEKGEQTEWEITLAELPRRAKPVAEASAVARTKVPAQVVPELLKLTSLTEKDIDVILQLISLPENSTPQWWTNYNYIEFLGDGRGFTATLYGACSGTGDLAMIFDELANLSPRSKGCEELLAYRDALKKKRGDDIKGIEPIKKIIKNLGEDSAWQQAVWKVYVKLYWKFATEWADKKGESAKRPGPVLKTPLTRGFMVDTAINHGADYDSLMDVVKRMPEAARNSKDELAWFRAFADAREKMLRSGYQDLDTSKTGDRCRLWKDLAAQGNTDLKPPFKALKGYWGTFTIK